jgi:hypothetical protein
MVRDRYQVFNEASGLWDKFDQLGNYLATKVTGGPFKNIEVRKGMKHPRR